MAMPKATLEVVDTSSAEPTILVCVGAEDPTPYNDNVFTRCKVCGKAIQHRPIVPPNATPHCAPCAMALVEVEMEDGTDVKFQITQKTFEEVVDYFDGQKRRSQN